MLFQQLAIVAALAASVTSQNIGDGTIPSQCQSLCSDVLSISRNCLTQNNNNNQASIQCICRAPNAGALVTTCEACVSEYNTGGGDPEGTRPAGNDVLSIVSLCSFTTTAYNRESASSILLSVASSFASASGSVIRTTSGSVVLTTSVPASTRPASQTGAAPKQTAAAGAALGLVGLAVGLL